MRVLGIVCSPRKGGNTEIMMEEALAGARSSGAQTELWIIAGKDVNPCDACLACGKTNGKCHVADDMQGLLANLNNSSKHLDGILKESRGSLQVFGQSGLYELTQAIAEARKAMSGLANVTERLSESPSQFLFEKEGVGLRVPTN